MRRIDYLNNFDTTPNTEVDERRALVGARFKSAITGNTAHGVLLKEYDNKYHIRVEDLDITQASSLGDCGREIYHLYGSPIIEISKENFYENFEFI